MTMPAFHHPVLYAIWIATCLLVYGPEIAFSMRLRSGKAAQKLDRGSMFIVILAANLGVAVGFIAAIDFPRFNIATHWQALFAAGIVVWIGGTIFRWYSIRTLGRFFTFDVAVSSGQSVIEAGPYRWLRHPSYAGALLGELGLGMTLTNGLAIVLPPLCLAAAYVYRIRIEEQALQQGLGDPYRAYMQRTWRLIPFIF